MAGLLEKHYQDEDAAREHLEAIRWPDGPICPHCGLIGEAFKLQGKTTRKGLGSAPDAANRSPSLWTQSSRIPRFRFINGCSAFI